jgi:hypothetical protein
MYKMLPSRYYFVLNGKVVVNNNVYGLGNLISVQEPILFKCLDYSSLMVIHHHQTMKNLKKFLAMALAGREK